MTTRHLFSGPFLSDRLRDHKAAIIRKIQNVTSLSELTDRFLEDIVGLATVKPLVLKTSDIKRAMRMEQIPGSMFPPEFLMMDEQLHRTYPKTVARIKIPFEGEEDVLQCRPSTLGFQLPQADVVGRRIEFDVVFWDKESDSDDVKRIVQERVELIESYLANANKDIAAFNPTAAGEIKKAFQAKLEKLSGQISALDDIGIAEEKESPFALATSSGRKQSKSIAREKPVTVQHVTVYVEKLFAETINQTNNNTGDVNNAIQSNE